MLSRLILVYDKRKAILCTIPKRPFSDPRRYAMPLRCKPSHYTLLIVGAEVEAVKVGEFSLGESFVVVDAVVESI
jgi:hypothetical protein